MSRMVWVVLIVLLAGVVPRPAGAQMLNARRLGMGGVVTSDNGAARSANVAFRAVPKGRGYGSIPLPIGLIQYAGDHPTFDSNDPNFNIFEILDLAANPPLTLSLSKPSTVSSDISVYIARDSLLLDLEDVRRAVPKDPMELGGVYHLMGVGFGIKSFFVAVDPLIHVRNTFDLDPKLRAALRDAQPFTSNTRYGLADNGVAQAAIAWQAGVAARALYVPAPDGNEGDGDDPSADDPRRNGATALYLGAAPKYLLGLAYGSAGGVGGVTTGDTLLGSSDPVAFDMTALTRHAEIGGDGGTGHGFGADIGGVLYWNRFELGIGVNDFGSEIDWSTTVRRHVYSDSLNEFSTTTVATDEKFTSRIPATTTINVARRMGPTTVAADLVNGELHRQVHLGAETWVGMLALRGGTYRDTGGHWQWTGGTGLRFGGIGLDLAVATHSRNIEEKRAAELSASLTLY